MLGRSQGESEKTKNIQKSSYCVLFKKKEVVQNAFSHENERAPRRRVRCTQIAQNGFSNWRGSRYG